MVLQGRRGFAVAVRSPVTRLRATAPWKRMLVSTGVSGTSRRGATQAATQRPKS